VSFRSRPHFHAETGKDSNPKLQDADSLATNEGYRTIPGTESQGNEDENYDTIQEVHFKESHILPRQNRSYGMVDTLPDQDETDPCDYQDPEKIHQTTIYEHYDIQHD